MSAFDIGSDALSFAEAYSLVVMLMQDSSSWLQAEVAGWKHPVSREAIVLMDVVDQKQASIVRRRTDFKPYPRPWSLKRMYGGSKTKKRTPEEVRALLRPAENPPA